MKPGSVRAREAPSDVGAAEADPVGLQVLPGDLREEHRRRGEGCTGRDSVQGLGLSALTQVAMSLSRAKAPRMAAAEAGMNGSETIA
jgi:hypothetical protein